MKNRVIYSDDGTLYDFTNSLNDFYNNDSQLSFVAAEDAIYIGTILPFNHFYMRLGSTINAETSAMTIQIWDGKAFQDVAELTDNTIVSGASLAQSEHIEFVPDKNKGWAKEDTVTPNGTEQITGLGDITIYDRYWIKITFSADLTASVLLSFIGQIFSNDNDVAAEFSDLTLSNTFTGWAAGKTDWNEQHYVAAKLIIKRLKQKKVIYDKNQILERENLTLASVQKVAEIIYNNFGDDYKDQRDDAKKEFEARLVDPFMPIDKDKDGIADPNEHSKVGVLYR